MSDQEQAEYHAWLAANPELAEPVGCSDYPELGCWNGLICEMLTYSYLKKGPE